MLHDLVGLVNSSNVLQTQFSYDPWGDFSTSGTANQYPYLFRGMEYDTTGLYHAGNIYYSPAGFVGSGSSLVASERTGRRCHAIEIDPLYVDTAVRRWQAYAHDRARHAVTGRFFDEMEAQGENHDGE